MKLNPVERALLKEALVQLPGADLVRQARLNRSGRREVGRAALLTLTGAAGGGLVGNALAPEGLEGLGALRGAALGAASGLGSYAGSRLIWALRRRLDARRGHPEDRKPPPVSTTDAPLPPVPGGAGLKEAGLAADPLERASELARLDAAEGFGGDRTPEAAPFGQEALARAGLAGLVGGAAGYAFDPHRDSARRLTHGVTRGLASSAGQLAGGALGGSLAGLVGATPGEAGLARSGLGAAGALASWLAADRAIRRAYPPKSARRKRASLAEGVYHHLPRLRGADALAGGLAGAGLGYAAHRLWGEPRERGGLRAAALGAAAGAGLGTLAGDRGRRYLANTTVPLGYGGRSAAPKGLGDLWKAVVRDEPLWDADAEAARAAADLRSQGKPMADADARGLADVLRGRHELLRRYLGVHTDRPGRDFWAKNPDGSLSVDPGHPQAGRRVRSLGLDDPAARDANQALLEGATDPGMAGPIVGGQTLAELPFPGGKLTRTLDRWDFALAGPERARLAEGIGRLARLDGGWLGSPASSGVDYAAGRTNAAVVGQLLKRRLAEGLLAHERPWIRQYTATLPGGRVAPLTGTGEVYGQAR